jgi:hypothetical protein
MWAETKNDYAEEGQQQVTALLCFYNLFFRFCFCNVLRVNFRMRAETRVGLK